MGYRGGFFPQVWVTRTVQKVQSVRLIGPCSSPVSLLFFFTATFQKCFMIISFLKNKCSQWKILVFKWINFILFLLIWFFRSAVSKIIPFSLQSALIQLFLNDASLFCHIDKFHSFTHSQFLLSVSSSHRKDMSVKVKKIIMVPLTYREAEYESQFERPVFCKCSNYF